MTRVMVAVAVWIALVTPAVVFAEFVQIEPIAGHVADQAVALLDGKKAVVASRQAAGDALPWALHEAAAVEITAALRTRGIEAVRAAAHPATSSLSGRRTEFKAADARRVEAVGAEALVTVEVLVADVPHLRLKVWPADGGAASERIEATLPPQSVDLGANVPDMNRRVVEYCQSRLGTMVADGICATLAGEALKAAGAKRSGVYTWGRELDATEPVLPGDVLQLEKVTFKLPHSSKSFEHHTAVVEEVRPDGFVILQQNVDPKGKVVHRDLWSFAAARSGIVRAYRPWTGDSPLPPVSPRRRESPRVARQGNAIDL